ncbi:aprataxin and PNK-like factor isoform X2 [Anas platyrhynchos]|uniref:aprataxin and PNK-like factor isoform X2 n=1 Tax=Anas platyrhynchos TaxID=8839 RepID=UPI0018D9FB05|nr:aprataxin and PNK-like factor isoform X2 [Anas platyrhynchos]
MAAVRLAPADGGCPVPLPPGETLLGRGPLLGITDKRVSRKHAILEVVDGQIHVNPCFYQSAENGRLLPLEAHEWHSLKFGDSFSLLVDKYIFKVISAHPVESTVRNNPEVGAEAAASVHPVEMSCSPSLVQPSCSTSEMQGIAKIRQNDSNSTLLVPPYDDENEQSKSIQRKRVLPSWMLDSDLLVQRVSKPAMKGGTRKIKHQERRESNMESLKSDVNMLQRKRLASEITDNLIDEEDDEEERSCLSSPSSENASGFPLESTMGNMEGNGKTETKKTGSTMEKNDRQLHSKRSKTTGQISNKRNRIEESENKEQITGSTSQQALSGRTSQYFGAQEGTHEPDADLDYETEISDTTRSVDASESSKQIKRKRTPCMYGTGCYRKNPIHFQQFSHPNDDDYHETDTLTEGNDDNRPECPYGTACYRKNPQHKLEYKHTAPPGTGRRTRQRTSKNGKRALEKDSDNDGEPNEYDLNDSFIDDEEEECEPTDEDSDWEPSSEDKDNEDVETLVKEANRFVKTKK